MNSGPLLLAWRHLTHRPGRSSLLVLCLALAALLPLAVEALMARFGEQLVARADATPLLAGAPGSRFDLTLNGLYFRGRVPRALPVGEIDRLVEDGLCLPIPILARDTAEGLPLVGTSNDYFRFRGLRPAVGGLPVQLGECVLGAEAARRTRLGVGDELLTDHESLYRIEAGYPLWMQVVGVLAPSGTADDATVFASLETVWISEGLGHGHSAAAEQDESAVIRADENGVVLDSSVFEFQRITPDNVDSFHFHDDVDALPVTAVVVVPRDAASATILKGRYRVRDTAQLLEPRAVIDEILGLVFQLKRFFDAHVLLVGLSTLCLFGLVVALSIRVRQREFETLARLGVARSRILQTLGLEYGIIVVAGLVLAALGAWTVVVVFENLLGWMG